VSARLIIAVPSKGRLQENAEAFFARAGLTLVRPRGARDYRGTVAGLEEVEIAYLSAAEIAGQLAAGAVHLGVTGEDLIREMMAKEPLSRPQSMEEIAWRLRLERIELYQLHRIDPRTPLEETLGALLRMHQQGKIGHIGLSEVTPAEIEAAQKIVPIVSVQNRYSLSDRRHEQTLAWCEARSIAFLPWYPMAAGKLLKSDHPFSRTLAQLATRYNAASAQLSLAWLLHRSPVMLPIPGTSQVKHLEENVAAASLQIGPDEWAQL